MLHELGRYDLLTSTRISHSSSKRDVVWFKSFTTKQDFLLSGFEILFIAVFPLAKDQLI